MNLPEARHYRKNPDGSVTCQLCPRFCNIAPGKSGRCRARVNRGGMLVAGGYGRAVSVAMDPIEKKPLFHFYPGSQILSTGPNGCNLSCAFCQNWEISQSEQPTEYIEPKQLAELAARHDSIGVAYTYTEPLVWFEYLLDACAAVREKGLVNVLVTNGTINPEPLCELLPLVDAMNIDLKSMSPQFYKDVCGGDLKTVLGTIEAASRSCHVELTNLVIPGLNDSPGDMEGLANWVAELDPLIPLHISRYFPRYRMEAPPTPEKTLKMFYDLARKSLKYVYLGNVQIKGTEDTYCPQCGRVVVERLGYRVRLTGLKDGNCMGCGRKADIVGLKD
jgi:pyruvate formate lyase activating enzyme